MYAYNCASGGSVKNAQTYAIKNTLFYYTSEIEFCYTKAIFVFKHNFFKNSLQNWALNDTLFHVIRQFM